ncbi:uncharacterized protein UV8b_07790 [Ustilaginoidea virens]|uniref:alpha-1,2-Mannosidase n=1 Tax=Ustilaginoidea virens TaxID=1159556 RepID=A0A8E5HYJ6_USTVR|nr:uncharacterized protein UV8b_07790 [Ustilaginoidea virens]QUC23549.1 hypothetical protein UV8b_07790 [Ustilaginoidea virens]
MVETNWIMISSRRTKRFAYLLGLSCFLFFCIARLSSSAESSELNDLERYMHQGGHGGPTALAVKSSFDWSNVEMSYLPPAKLAPLPKGPRARLPRVQGARFPPESFSNETLRLARRNQVRRVFRDDWENYRQYAWGKDALNPVSATAKDQFSGWAATLVDSLDTLWIMGLRDEFNEAVAFVGKLDFGIVAVSDRVNIFETNIRYLGGLLAAYDLSKSKVLLAKAIELGNLIYAGFNTPSRMPVDFIDFKAAKAGTGLEIEYSVVSASPGTLSLEMTRLSQITGDPRYFDAIDGVMRKFHEQQPRTKLPGLWPVHVSMRHLDLSSGRSFSLGGGADSLYEYLPKMHALLGGREPMYENMTVNFMRAATGHLFFRPMVPGEEDILIAGNVDVGSGGRSALDPESSHLACFIGGTMALAGRLTGQPDQVETGAKLARGCAYAYHAFPSGMMPETYNMVACEPRLSTSCPWNETRWIEERGKRSQWKPHLPKGFTTAKDPRYILRPEAIESIFYMYRITGDPGYQETAWEMFQATHRAAKTKHGHGAVHDVTIATDEASREDNVEDYMESFWFAETLKYYYLIFSSPSLISLDEFVLNTEAHPFRIPR